MTKILFKYPDGKIKEIDAPNGISILEVAHKNSIPLEGACEGSLACSTCHIIIEDESVYSSLPAPTEDEDDMLDLAFGLTRTSRLGCQIIVNEGLNGIVIKLPEATRNMMLE
jgi:ferredoxin, 2Fe-2S